MPLHPSLIDPALPLSQKEKKAIHRTAWSKWYNRPSNIMIYLIGFLVSMGVMMFAPDVIRHFTGDRHWYDLPVSFAAYVLLIYLLYCIMRRHHFAPLLYAELRSRGFDVCPKCGYWLRDLDSTVTNCPECGHMRDAIPPTSPR